MRNSKGQFVKGCKRSDMVGNKYREGIKPTNAFEKGHIPWNKGKKGTQADENNGMWKGDDAGITAKHLWIKRKYGDPEMCENCGSVENVQWSNIDHEYRRVRRDWNQLCAGCHKKQDYANGLMGNSGFQKGNYYGR